MPHCEPAPAAETPADRLRAAAGYIRDHFHRRSLVDADGNVCALGAILRLRQEFDDLMHPSVRAVMLLAADAVADLATNALHSYVVDHADELGVVDVDSRREYAATVIEGWNDVHVADGPAAAAVMEKAAAWWEESR